MIKLIVHADDFGLDEEVNNGILEAHTNGIVTSASLIACGSAFDHAVDISRSFPSLDIGVHLTLIEEKPLSDQRVIPSIVDEKGGFIGNIYEFAKCYCLGRIDVVHVYRELDLQIQKALDSGLAISHLDSHQHAHVIPGIYQQVVKLAEKYKIGVIRLPREELKGYMFTVNRSLRVLERAVLGRMCLWNNTCGYRKADYFLGFYYGGRLNKANLMRTLSEVNREGVYELMCHPGYMPAGNRYAHWMYQWEEELAAVTDREVRDVIDKKNIGLVSYRDWVNHSGHADTIR